MFKYGAKRRSIARQGTQGFALLLQQEAEIIYV
jgi:hypothetical protein